MILEGIVTTLDGDGRLNVAPMGPRVDESLATLELRPFQTSQTYRNLKVRPEGVFHVVDDVLLLAQAAIGSRSDEPATFAATEVQGRVLESACRWFEFRIEELDDSEPRTRMVARVVHQGRIKDFFGLNRAKHAVVEAAILATRTHLLPPAEIRAQLAALKPLIEKTAGPREREAFALLEAHIDRALET
jgi:hypothetical protein